MLNIRHEGKLIQFARHYTYVQSDMHAAKLRAMFDSLGIEGTTGWDPIAYKRTLYVNTPKRARAFFVEHT